VKRSIAALKRRTSSEMVAGARLVKSISNMPMAWIQDFSSHKPKTVIFTSGDDSEAKRIVIDLIDSIGFAAIDLGSLAKGAAMHQVGAPSGSVPHSGYGHAWRCLDPGDPIDAFDHARKQRNQQPCLLVRETAQHLTIALQ
jgi:hypothetical protein